MTGEPDSAPVEGLPYRYRVFDLSLASDRPLAARADDHPASQADVILRHGVVPDRLIGPDVITTREWSASPNEALLSGQPPYRYWLRDGREIRIDQAPDATDRWADYALHGSVWGALLHQRGLLALHASTVLGPDGAWVFLGRRGAGKSSTVSGLLERGYAMLADDISVLRAASGGGLEVLPSFPFVRLWREAGEALGWDQTQARQVRPDLAKYCHHGVRFHDRAVPLSRLFLLWPDDRHASCSVHALEASAIGAALRHNTYRRRLLAGMGRLGPHLERLDAWSRHITGYELRRPKDAGGDVRGGIERLLDCVEALAKR